MKLLIALGGNALMKKGEEETSRTLLTNIKDTCKTIAPIVKKHDAIITFGNGIEVGLLVLQNELAKKKVAPFPLDILGAESQGMIGYPLEEQLINELRGSNKSIVTVLTQTLVSKSDPAFHNPTKFIGPFYNKKQATLLTRKGFIIKKDSNRGFRRVVPSPQPLKIIEAKIIQQLVRQHNLVIAAGGGGIPVVLEHNKLKGVEAVIDKDLASACLASSIQANQFIMLTAVPNVYLNFGEKNQAAIKNISLKKLKLLYAQGHFPPGSMGPKMLAAMQFLSKSPQGEVIITDAQHLKAALKGKAGTIITT